MSFSQPVSTKPPAHTGRLGFRGGAAEAAPPEGFSAPEDLVDGAVRERDHEQVAVGPGLDVRPHAEVRPEEQALALRDVVLGVVVGDAILEAWIIHPDLPPVPGQVEAEQVAAEGVRRGCAREEVVAVLRPRAPLERKPIPAGGTANFQLNSGSL